MKKETNDANYQFTPEMEKDLNYWKKNAEEDYMHVPISVLRYITELENSLNEALNISKLTGK